MFRLDSDHRRKLDSQRPARIIGLMTMREAVDRDVLIRLTWQKEVETAWGRKRDSMAGVVVHDAFRPGTKLYSQVIAERDEFLNRQKALQNPSTVSKGELEKMVKTAVAEASEPKAGKEGAGMRSDVDEPKYRRQERADQFAVVVGVEKYRSLPPAKFAERGVAAVRAHLMALGIPARNIFYAADQDATRASLVKAVHTWLPSRINGDSTVFSIIRATARPTPRQVKPICCRSTETPKLSPIPPIP